jgi:hypothetical protein
MHIMMLCLCNVIIPNTLSVLFSWFLCCTDEECHWENVRVLKDGETVSVDGTHLGTNVYCLMRLESSLLKSFWLWTRKVVAFLLYGCSAHLFLTVSVFSLHTNRSQLARWQR